jgi:hypothetical protein
LGDHKNAVNTETGSPSQRKALCFNGPLQNELLAKEFKRREEALAIAHY